MKEIKRYAPGDLTYFKKSLGVKDRKILNDFITFLKGGMGDAKVNIFERQLLMIRDVSGVPYDKWDLKKLREFLALLNKSDLADSTKNDIRKHFKRFLRENYKDWSQRFNELKDLRSKGNGVNVEKINASTIIKPEELEKLIRKAENLKFKALIILMYETGGRPKEVLTIRWKDLDLKNGDCKLISTKNKTARNIPIQESVLHLKRYKQEYPYPNITKNDWVFPSFTDRKKHMGVNHFGSKFKKLSRMAIDREITPYFLRHTRATELQKKLTAKVYERVMDHSLEMASRYSHLNKDDIRDEMLEKIYHIEELTPEEKDKMKKLEKKVLDLQKGMVEIKKKTISEINFIEELTTAIKSGNLKGSDLIDKTGNLKVLAKSKITQTLK